MLCGWRITRMRRTRKKESSDFFSFFFTLFFLFCYNNKTPNTLFCKFLSSLPLKDDLKSSSFSDVKRFGLPSSGRMGEVQVKGGKAKRAFLMTHSALLWLTADLTPPTSQSTPAQHWCVSIHQSLKRTHSPPHTKRNLFSYGFYGFFFEKTTNVFPALWKKRCNL